MENKKNNSTSKKEIVISIFFAILFVGLVAALIIANFRINTKRDEMVKRIEQLKADIKSLEDRNKELNKNLNSANTEENLERLAREQLGLKKPGEEAVVIKNPETETNPSGAKPASASTGSGEARARNFWNPLEWWNLLWGK